ncbi:sigma-70 family RNA polymerase sigma factor [Planctomycetales bacterium ZRK34]|nr:sigma-70 family RNA polymerase sigma factor [Planctomycetales bacterium ZRK34]
MQPSREFVRLLTDSQSRLYAYIFALVGDEAAVSDVLQETNLVLLEKCDEAMAASSFTAWAFGVARRKTLVHWQTRGRERLVFDESLLKMLADDGACAAEKTAGRMGQLKRCIGQLPDLARRVIDARYQAGQTVSQIADLIGRSTTATSQLLYRTRLSLLECIQAAEADAEEERA